MVKGRDPGTGERIRARRLDLGLRQADLAASAGVSPSYLNLIEHGRRRIAGPLLDTIAAALDVAPQLLADGADRQMLDALRQAAGGWKDGAAELAKVEELAARYPGWAGLLAAQSARIEMLEARAQLLADRITYDPALADALHGMISAVTAIRSTAAILTSDETLDTDWRARFHRNIHDDAMRLARDSEALIGYLEPPEAASDLPLSPLEEVEALLERTGWHLDALEQGQDPARIDGIAALRPPARALFDQFAAQYAQDAAALPAGVLADTAAAQGYDPLAIAGALDCAPQVVLRRLASLPTGEEHPDFGLVVCDASGFPIWVKPVAGFALPRVGACPLWPVFTALGQVGRPVEAEVDIPGQPHMTVQCFAIAGQVRHARADLPPLVHSTMLIRADARGDGVRVLSAGLSCRICPRADCLARREPSALGTG